MNLLDLFVKVSCEDNASSEIGRISDGAIAKGVAIGNIISSAVTEAASMAVDAIESVVGGAYEAFAAYEQLSGGVTKLFGDADQIVLANARNAYATAGISANAYMETSTRYSAALINDLGGNFEEAANYVDMAVRVVSDNINTFGTDIDSVNSAILGFSRGNFTMLDNLSLGYAGTREGMEQLIADANEYAVSIGLAGDLSIESFADIIQAVELVQEKQNIAGTTLREGATTVEGATNQMRASWENFITALGDPENWDLTEQAGILTDSIGTYLENAIPLLVDIFKGLGIALVEELPDIVSGLASTVDEMFNEMFGFDIGISEKVDVISDIFGRLASVVMEILPPAFEFLGGVVDILKSAFSEMAGLFMDYVMPAIEDLKDPIIHLFESMQNLMPLIDALVEIVGSVVMTVIYALVETIGTLIETVASIIDWIYTLDDKTEAAANAISDYWNYVKANFVGAMMEVKNWITNIISSITTFASTIKEKVLTAFDNIKTGIKEKTESIISFVKEIPQRIAEALSNLGSLLLDNGKAIMSGLLDGIKHGVQGVFDFVGGIAGTIVSLKGPEEYDKKLLIPNGGWIMESLNEGLTKGFEEVKKNVSNMAGSISDELIFDNEYSFGVTGAAASANQTVYNFGDITISAESLQDVLTVEKFASMLRQTKAQYA